MRNTNTGCRQGLLVPALTLLCASAAFSNPVVQAQLEGGVWRSATPPGTRVIDYPLTVLGQERLASFRLDRDPLLQCEPPGMPRAFMPLSPMDFSFDGDVLTIRYETMDVVRQVHLSGQPLPNDAPHTPNGHALGRWQGDTLVIETTHLSAGETTRNGVPKSDAMTLREILDVRETSSGLVLEVRLTITDPEMFREPYTTVYDFVLEPEWELLPFDCQPTEY